MNKIGYRKAISLFLVGIVVLSGFQGKSKNNDLARAKSTLQQIFSLYDAGHDHLLNETYPDKSDNKVSYLADGDTLTVKRVAYLWPTSGVFSGVNALLKATSGKQYLQLLKKKVLPGLEQYYDSLRKPAAYQSYITLAGKSDRYYDDNIWLALDFCETYKLTGNKAYLEEAQHIAKSAIDHFTEEYTTDEGNKIRLFKNTGNWFNSILFRGFTELYMLDGNYQYLAIFRNNMDHLWNHVRDKSGLFSKDWKGQKEDEYNSLLDQSSLVEIWATLARHKKIE